MITSNTVWAARTHLDSFYKIYDRLCVIGHTEDVRGDRFYLLRVLHMHKFSSATVDIVFFYARNI